MVFEFNLIAVLIVVMAILAAIAAYFGNRQRQRAAASPLVQAVNGAAVSMCSLPVRARPIGQRGVEVTVTAPRAASGYLKMSGPSPNAGTNTPEVKLTIGDGAFDYQFWIIRDQPRGFAADLLLSQDELRAQMQACPFGTWEIDGAMVVFTTKRAAPEQMPRLIETLCLLTTAL